MIEVENLIPKPLLGAKDYDSFITQREILDNHFAKIKFI